MAKGMMNSTVRASSERVLTTAQRNERAYQRIVADVAHSKRVLESMIVQDVAPEYIARLQQTLARLETKLAKM